MHVGSIKKNLAIANRSRVSCINTNRYSHNSATSGESRRYVVALIRRLLKSNSQRLNNNSRKQTQKQTHKKQKLE